MSDAQKFWSETKDWWVECDRRYNKQGVNKPSESYLAREFKGFKSVLEIGAGTGRLIGMLSKNKSIDCHSVDVSSGLCELVKAKYPNVTVHNTPVQDLTEFKDHSIDLIYTYQCLQHVPNGELRAALNNIFRVAKKEVWLIEGFVPGKEPGEQTHPVNGGSFVYYFDQMFKCYQVDDVQQGKVMAYRIKVSDA